jgi:cell division protein FtsN
MTNENEKVESDANATVENAPENQTASDNQDAGTADAGSAEPTAVDAEGTVQPDAEAQPATGGDAPVDGEVKTEAA